MEPERKVTNPMYHSLSLALTLFWGCFWAAAEEAPDTNATASVVSNLVEQLVSPIGPPPDEIKDYNGGKTDMKKLDAHLKALSEGWMAPQVAKAREKLISMGTPIFPQLVKHLGDKRYSYSFCSAAWADYPVGYAVREIMADVVGEGFRPYGYKARHNPNGANGQPSFGQMIREIGAEKYANHAKGITTRQAQKEYVQWYLEKEKAYGFEDKKQEQDIMGPCLKKLSEL
jgi:hypothetical protein